MAQSVQASQKTTSCDFGAKGDGESDDFLAIGLSEDTYEAGAFCSRIASWAQESNEDPQRRLSYLRSDKVIGQRLEKEVFLDPALVSDYLPVEVYDSYFEKAKPMDFVEATICKQNIAVLSADVPSSGVVRIVLKNLTQEQSQTTQNKARISVKLS